MRILGKVWQVGVVGTFFAGLALLLPTALTVLIVDWFVNRIIDLVGPGTSLGNLLTAGGTLLIGTRHQTIAFWIGVILVLLGIWMLGIAVKWFSQHRLDAIVGRLFDHFPFIGALYRAVAQVMSHLGDKTEGKFAGMRVCLCRFGSGDGPAVLGLLTSSETYVIGDVHRRLVYLPTSPLPMSGGLVLMPERSITLVPEISVDSLLRIYFSLGALAPGALPSASKQSETIVTQSA
jgi:uncharacterized membrane protein